MIKLWGNEMPYRLADVEFDPHIKAYPANSTGAVVVLPGGGYEKRAQHEGETVGEWFQSIGITAFVLEYRVAPYQHPAEISDAMRAVRYVRHHAEEYGIDPQKIAIMGFSAGGHLAGSVSVHYDKKMYELTDEIDNESAKPNLSILCYPVIDMGEYRHDGSRQNLIGRKPTEEMKEFMSLHKQVTKDTPEAFIWHASPDIVVPVDNSLLYASALSACNVDFELHIYPVGSHGIGLAEDNAHVAKWSKNLEGWLVLKGWK